MIVFLIFLAINVGIGTYIFNVIRKHSDKRWLLICHCTICFIAIASVAPVAFIARKEVSDSLFMDQMWGLIVYLSITFSQIVFTIISLLAKLPRLFLRHKSRDKKCDIGICIAAAAAFVVFALFWWGALINRYQIDVVEVEVPIAALPAEFDGYRIAQISDLHVGSYDGDTTFVSKLVDRINELNPDLVVFTGDIVNRHAAEAYPFMPVLSRLHGSDGQYAVLGNHDYADYYYPVDAVSQKEADREHLAMLFGNSSLSLLRDSTVMLCRGNDSIALIGVQNIGTGRFPVYGSLERAYINPDDNMTKILLSHDPSHWETAIRDNDDINIALTLSGHTHAMQTRLLGFSPASWAYKDYAGLVTDSLGRHLYINIGVGTVGTPMRIGATPEITLLTLRRK
ncbi:MAG: metallophosphoesterase [Muribaculaceae bacterium]|nr:metallophosphoesterase [Muribaculaceae bacterium]